MRGSIVTSVFLVMASGAVGAGALPLVYSSSYELNSLTNQVFASLGLPSNSVGVGDDAAQTSMESGNQSTAPMLQMPVNDGALCAGGLGNAQGLVIGLDAVTLLASEQSGGSPSCNGPGAGLTYSNAPLGISNWKQTLAVLYGGEADPNNPSQIICNGPKRTALANNWSALFQNGCANPSSACGDSLHQTCTSPTLSTDPSGNVTITPGRCSQPAAPVLWHAFRLDDSSGASRVFAEIVGLLPRPSATNNHGFGTSPFCNAMNWDTSPANVPSGATNCTLDKTRQFVGPGGIYNPSAAAADQAAAGHLIHRRPPPAAYGDAPDPTNTSTDSDVLPTGMQDNDPIRRPCVGTAVGASAKEGEEVCNIDMVNIGGKLVGQLGLVLPIADVTYIQETAGLNPFPTNQCIGAFAAGAPPKIFNCAPLKTTRHSGECANGDQLYSAKCFYPTDNTTTNCQSASSKHIFSFLRTGYASITDGRAWNYWHLDGTGPANDGQIGFLQQKYPTATGTESLDSAQGLTRLHVKQTIPAGGTACTNPDPTLNVGCMTQADTCTVGMAGLSAKYVQGAAALQVNTVSPGYMTMEALGGAGEYPLTSKVYLNSLAGFNALASNSFSSDEFTVAQNEANPGFINSLLLNNNFVLLGSQSPAGQDTPFCEDFNQQTVCGAASNDNSCARITAPGIPTASTVCGDGIKGPYEECDLGASNGAPNSACTSACYCVGTFPCQ